jgi:hypothetical protein
MVYPWIDMDDDRLGDIGAAGGEAADAEKAE